MKIFLVIYALVLCTVSAINEEYCNMASCKGRPHIGCRNTGAYSPSCDPKAELITLNKNLQRKFIHFHNQLRNKIASGKLPGYEPAAQMGAVAWDPELAKLAEFNVKQCEMIHDECRNTKKFKYAGQNLAMSAGTPAITPEEAIKDAIHRWFDEHVDADMSIIKSFRSNGRQIGHFTALVNERNSRIGCAILRTPKNGMTAYFTACNYARTNIIGEPVYKSGSPASGCKTRKHRRFPSLCIIAERYDV